MRLLRLLQSKLESLLSRKPLALLRKKLKPKRLQDWLLKKLKLHDRLKKKEFWLKNKLKSRLNKK